MKLESFVLENEYAKLSPLNLDNYHQLIPIASQPKLVQFSPADIESPEGLKNYVETALKLQANNLAIPFIIYDKRSDIYAGSTRYMNIDWKNKVLHIGATWIGRAFQGGGLNTQIKLMMLNHAFGPMAFEKVEFRIDERNLRSRKAVEKLGGVLEGVLRSNVFLLDGYKRNTCCYGILKEEWEKTGENLQ